MNRVITPRRGIVLSALAVFLLALPVMAAGTPAIDWWLIGGGGGHAENAPYTVDGTIGQPVVGTTTDTGYELCSGFWCGVVEAAPPPLGYTIYLPIILKNYP